MILELNTNSYEIIAAVLLREPKNGYAELADQPLNKIPYTPREERVKV